MYEPPPGARRAFAFFLRNGVGMSALTAERYGAGLAAVPAVVSAVREAPAVQRARPVSLEAGESRLLRKHLFTSWEEEFEVEERLSGTPDECARGAVKTTTAAYRAAHGGAQALCVVAYRTERGTHTALANEVANALTQRQLAPWPWDSYLTRRPLRGGADRSLAHGVDASTYRGTRLDPIYQLLRLTLACERIRRARRQRRPRNKPGAARPVRQPVIVTPFHILLCLRMQAEHGEVGAVWASRPNPAAAAQLLEVVADQLTAGLTVMHTLVAAAIGSDAYARLAADFVEFTSGLQGRPLEGLPAARPFATRLAAIAGGT